jgi:hypothetical protein
MPVTVVVRVVVPPVVGFAEFVTVINGVWRTRVRGRAELETAK